MNSQAASIPYQGDLTLFVVIGIEVTYSMIIEIKTSSFQELVEEVSIQVFGVREIAHKLHTDEQKKQQIRDEKTLICQSQLYITISKADLDRCVSHNFGKHTSEEAKHLIVKLQDTENGEKKVFKQAPLQEQQLKMEKEPVIVQLDQTDREDIRLVVNQSEKPSDIPLDKPLEKPLEKLSEKNVGQEELPLKTQVVTSGACCSLI